MNWDTFPAFLCRDSVNSRHKLNDTSRWEKSHLRMLCLLLLSVTISAYCTWEQHLKSKQSFRLQRTEIAALQILTQQSSVILLLALINYEDVNTYGGWRYKSTRRMRQDSVTTQPLNPKGKIHLGYWIGSWVVENGKISFLCRGSKSDSSAVQPVNHKSLYRLSVACVSEV